MKFSVKLSLGFLPRVGKRLFNGAFKGQKRLFIPAKVRDDDLRIFNLPDGSNASAKQTKAECQSETAMNVSGKGNALEIDHRGVRSITDSKCGRLRNVGQNNLLSGGDGRMTH